MGTADLYRLINIAIAIFVNLCKGMTTICVSCIMTSLEALDSDLFGLCFFYTKSTLLERKNGGLSHLKLEDDTKMHESLPYLSNAYDGELNE